MRWFVYFYRRPVLASLWSHLLFISLAVVAVYYHTLDVPFYLDDFPVIRDNPLVYQWRGWAALWRDEPLRFVGYLSFALNYRLGQFNPAGYHLLNIIIHILAGWSVYGFTRGILRSPRMPVSADSDLSLWLPVFAALLFVLHPLHTQAITYIAQRFASLAALFYLTSLACYVQARLSETKGWSGVWGICCLIAALAAFFTKQNTFTLPLAIILVEVAFFRSSFKRLFLLVSLSLFGLLIVAWAGLTFGFGYENAFSLKLLLAWTRDDHSQLSRIEYGATQMGVLWTYIRLFFLPVGQHIDYALLPAQGLLRPGVLLAMSGHLFLITLAFYGLRRWPLPAFAVLFYYLAHLIESGFLPINDLIFEHRAYLSDFGLCLLVAWVAAIWSSSVAFKRMSLAVLFLILVVLGTMTWQRNQLWRDPIALWHDNTAKAPSKARGWSSLGKYLLDADRTTEALPTLFKAIKLQQQDGSINVFDVVNLVATMIKMQQYQNALQIIREVENQPMRPFDKAKFLTFQGVIMARMQQYLESEKSLRAALQVFPESIDARLNLASVIGSQGRFDEAESLYREVLRVDPDNQAAKANLRELARMRH